MSWALFELARNPDFQDKLRDEISSVKANHGDELTYEGIFEMEYLNKIFHGKFLNNQS